MKYGRGIGYITGSSRLGKGDHDRQGPPNQGPKSVPSASQGLEKTTENRRKRRKRRKEKIDTRKNNGKDNRK